MGRLSRTQVNRREARKKGGRGRKSLKTPQSPVIQTPIRPRTTAWRQRNKATTAEKALHEAALIRIQLMRESTSHLSIIGSRPSTAENMSSMITGPASADNAMEGIGENVFSLSGCESVGTGGGSDRSRADEEDRENGFEDIDLPPTQSTQYSGNESSEEYYKAIKCWPRVKPSELRRQILEKGNSPRQYNQNIIINIKYKLKVYQISKNYYIQDVAQRDKTIYGTFRFYI